MHELLKNVAMYSYFFEETSQRSKNGENEKKSENLLKNMLIIHMERITHFKKFFLRKPNYKKMCQTHWKTTKTVIYKRYSIKNSFQSQVVIHWTQSMIKNFSVSANFVHQLFSLSLLVQSATWTNLLSVKKNRKPILLFEFQYSTKWRPIIAPDFAVRLLQNKSIVQYFSKKKIFYSSFVATENYILFSNLLYKTLLSWNTSFVIQMKSNKFFLLIEQTL